MFRRPIAWIVFAAVAAACIYYSIVAFPRAFPLVSLHLEMDRTGALETARALAGGRGWGPASFRQAASFEVDEDVRSFVELEAGGRQAYIDMLAGDLYAPYTWRVRHFAPGETNETLIRFTAAGGPYGFKETLPEDAPGAALGQEAARAIAEKAATSEWGVALDAYALVEHQQKTNPTGRVDHTIVYERPDATVGEGRYRLRLSLTGDRLTELSHFVKIPEAFERRYAEMRSANEIISFAAVVGAAVLYLGGGVLGLFLLLRERRVLWRMPLLWAAVVSSGMALMTMNQWPLTWMTYDTAVAPTTFVLQRVAMLAGQLLGLGALYFLAFAAAECFTRAAFPDHIQLWKTWAKPVASSPGMLGRTIAGYLLVPVDLAFLVLFYAFAFDKLGWWSPSEALVDPNILATPFPWLTSIAVSLQAGFWEECAFRAIPIAGAALLGRRFGGRRWWIAAALVLEALVFGAGHANYPTQPAYARVAELFLPALFWGFIYIGYGLIPVIVLHVTFDVALISLPLWVSASHGLWDDRALIVLLTLAPLWVVLAARWRHGRWEPGGEAALNRSWSPEPAAVRPAVEPAPRQAGLGSRGRMALGALGLIGAAAWVMALNPPNDAPPLQVGRAEAIAAGTAALEQRGWTPPPAFRPLAMVQADISLPQRYVWQEGGREAYARLLGVHVPAPRWHVRWATFEGDVATRAEEFEAWVSAAGQVTRARHRLPEAAPGGDIAEQPARELAVAAVRETWGRDPAELEEVKASPSKLANRRDWTFELKDPAALAGMATGSMQNAEARLAVEIAGDAVVDAYRYLHVPEEWERSERNRQTLSTIVLTSALVLVGLAFVSGAVFAGIRWSRSRFGARIFLISTLSLIAIRVPLFLIAWPAASAQFQTEAPWAFQAIGVVVGGLLAAIVGSLVVGMNLGLIERWRPEPAEDRGPARFVSGVALGAIACGLAASIALIAPATTPQWAPYGPAGFAAPLLATAIGPVSGLVTTTSLLLLVMVAADRFTSGWSRRKGIVSALLLVTGIVLLGMRGVDTLMSWLGAGLLVGAALLAAYVMVLRFDLSLLPAATGTIAALDTVRIGLANAYAGALTGCIAAAILILVLAFFWQRGLARSSVAS